jgi:predicted membrane-bound spermidine synthase
MRALFLSVFFASGAAALLYQVVWQRLLTFTTGTDVYSVTLVVAAFMLGMGVGSLAGAHLADRLEGRQRLVAFACSEVAIAVFAFASAFIFYDWLYIYLGERDFSWIAIGALSFLSTLWPTFFMGMSLPLAARAITDDPRQPARWVPLLYGWNTLGGAFGAIAAVTILFRTMSFVSSLRFGAAVNGACAIATLWIASRFTTASESGPRVSTTAASTRAVDWKDLEPIGLYALAGFIALSLEILWFRILGVILKSDAFTFGYLLAIYLIGLGLGSLATNAMSFSKWPPQRMFLLSQAAIPLYAAISLGVFVGSLGDFSITKSIWNYLGQYGPLSRSEPLSKLSLALGLVTVILMAPATFLMGVSFGFLQRSVQTDLGWLGRRVGWLQTANIAGGVLGALVTGFLLLNYLGTSGTFRVLVGLGGVYLWLAASPHLVPCAAAVVLTVAAFAAIPVSSALWPRLHGATPDAGLFVEDSTGVAFLKRDAAGTTTVYANGLGQSWLPFGRTHTVLGALPALIHPAPVRVAVIGLGSGDTTWAIGGRAETAEIHSIEIVAPALSSLRALATRYPYPGLRNLLLDTRVQHHLTDGRAFLLKNPLRYDLIEADALRPTSAYAGNLYSVEFFSLLRSRLNPGGFAVTWTPTPRVVASIIKVFPNVLVTPELAVGSDRPIPFDPDVIRRRLEDPFTKSYYTDGGVNLPDLLAAYLNHRPTIFGPDFDRSSLVDLNQDLFPRDEFMVRPCP